MKFTDLLKEIPKRAEAIRDSLGIDAVATVNAGTSNQEYRAAVGEGLTRRDRPVRSRESERRQVMAFTSFMADIYGGRRPISHLREAMTLSDFPNLFADVMYRQLLGNYETQPVSYPEWAKIVDANDFRAMHLYAIDGGQGLLGPSGTSLQAIKEREPYPEIAFQESPFSVRVAKYGRRFGLSFEMGINDDLNAFRDRPQMMAIGARNSEEYLMTSYLADANGPHASFFSDAGGAGLVSSIPVVSGVKNKIVNNPALTIQGLQTAMKLLRTQKGLDNQPIAVKNMVLIVPPALEITAQNIMNALQIRIGSSTGNPTGAANGGGTIDQFIYTTNWMSGRVKLVVNDYLPIISTATKNGVNVGDTSWYLVAAPNAASRPAFVFAFMRGRRSPQLFVKDSNARMLGGGDSDALEGDFDTDSVDYKMRHIFGATSIDPRMAVASDGSEAA